MQIIVIFKAQKTLFNYRNNSDPDRFFRCYFELLDQQIFFYRKPNNNSLDIHIQTNNCNTIENELCGMSDRRISKRPCSKEEFNKTNGIYEKALTESNFKLTLNFNEQQSERNNRNRKIT